jgi:hypothetical protein
MASALTAERLRELLSYDPETGVFRWRVTRGGTARAGTVAGASRRDGYVLISIGNVRYLAHRLAWLWVTSTWPPDEVDHKNGDPSDNRLENLRPATRSQNNANVRAQKNNRAGLKGVCFDGRYRLPYEARIYTNGQKRVIGRYTTPEAANAAYAAAAQQHFGAFARA